MFFYVLSMYVLSKYVCIKYAQQLFIYWDDGQEVVFSQSLSFWRFLGELQQEAKNILRDLFKPHSDPVMLFCHSVKNQITLAAKPIISTKESKGRTLGFVMTLIKY